MLQARTSRMAPPAAPGVPLLRQVEQLTGAAAWTRSRRMGAGSVVLGRVLGGLEVALPGRVRSNRGLHGDLARVLEDEGDLDRL